MMVPGKPLNEEGRLRALASYRILDTGDELGFDAITRLAAELMGVPIALVSIIDEDRQWFKSRYGLDAKQTPRDISFCGHVVAEDRLLVVEDATTDERFADNPLVVGGPRVRFYAGFPLRTSDGFTLGTLCVIDSVPHQLDSHRMGLLNDLTTLVVNLLELRRNSALVQQREIELEAQRQFFSLSLDLMCTIDARLNLQQLNPAWSALLGWSPEELRSRPLSEFVHPDDLSKTLAEAARLTHERTPSVHFEHRFMHKDGRWISLAWVATISDQTFYAAARDVSEQRRVELLQSEFVSTVSHELRTPLTAIRGALGLVANGVTGALAKDAAEYVDMALANTDRLVRLVNDILDIEKFESGRISFVLTRVSLCDATRRAVATHEPLAMSRGVTLHLVEPLAQGEVLVDADRLDQVFANLLSNAAKFSNVGDTVDVAVQQREQRLRVTVRDRGAGVPVAFRARIFQRFSQADASDARPKGGSGLGLNIAKTIVEHMQGRIGFDDAEGGGTVFYFELPLAV